LSSLPEDGKTGNNEKRFVQRSNSMEKVASSPTDLPDPLPQVSLSQTPGGKLAHNLVAFAREYH
jgi:hypothetical protein